MLRPDYTRADKLVDDILTSFNAALNDRDRDHVVGIVARALAAEQQELRDELADVRRELAGRSADAPARLDPDDVREDCGCVRGNRFTMVKHCGGHGIPPDEPARLAAERDA